MAKRIISPTLLKIQQEYYEKHGLNKATESSKEVNISVEPKQELGISGIKDFGIYVSSINNCKPIVTMEDKEVVKKILDHYTEVYNHITQDFISNNDIALRQYIYNMGVHTGICRYARVCLGVSIAEMWWITQYENRAGYFWFEIPTNLFTNEEVINSILLRVKRLEEVYNSMQEIGKSRNDIYE